MSLFIIGFIDMLIVTAWTKSVAQTQVVVSGLITLINVLVWYYVIQRLMEDLYNWQLVLMYATGCALGTIVATYHYKVMEKRQQTIQS